MTDEAAAKSRRRMSCWNCPRYSRTERRCREGKANPRRKSDSLVVAQLLGIRMLCHYNPYREPLVMRMFFPATPETRRAMAALRPRSRAAEFKTQQFLQVLEESRQQHGVETAD